MQELLQTRQQKNVRESIRKRHKHKSETKMEMRSYSIQKFFEAMKNTGNCPMKRRSSSSSDDEGLKSTAVKSNNDASLGVRNVLENLKNSMVYENKITNYFKDVKYAPYLSNSKVPTATDKENVENNDFLEKKTARDIIESMKLNSTASYLIKQKLKKDSSSDSQSVQTCARYMKDISMAVEEKMHIEQTLEDQKTTFEQFMEKVCEQIRNKSLPETLRDSNEQVCDRQIMELDQNPISRFIESLRQRNTRRSAKESSEIFHPSPSSINLSSYTRLTSDDTKSQDNKKIFTEQANPRFFFSETKHMNSIQNHGDNSNNTSSRKTENEKESIDSADYSEIKLVKNLQFIESFTLDKNSDIYKNSSITENDSKESIAFVDFLKKTGDLSQNTDQMYIPREDQPKKNLNNSQFLKLLISDQELENSAWIKQVSETKSSEIIEGNTNNNFVNINERNSQPNFEQNDSHQMNSQTHPDEKYINSVESYSINSGKVLGNDAGNINLMQDEEIRNILTENFEKHERLYGRLAPKNKFQIDSLCKKLSSPGQQERRCQFKRFRKGKVKIYRLAKLKKSAPNKDESETLNVDELLKKMSQGFVGINSNLAPSKSSSSISTTSSYVTDETLSETLSTGSRELSSPQRNLRKGLNEICKDRTLFCDKKQCICDEYDPDEIKIKIQNIFLQVLDDLTNGREPFLKYRRQSFENCTVKDGRLQFKSDDVSLSVIKSGVRRSHGRFKLILYILKKIQMLLETNTKMTKREIFYQLKHLIGDQRITDRAINSISCLLDVGMWALNIVAQKGLVFGNLKILLASGETINCNVPGTLIPQDIGEIIEIQSTAYFILVVEKESIFHKLIEEDLPNRLTRPFVMITGKGFPDLNTQLFLKKLWTVMCVPVFLLVDADPDGINIMLNYRFGSVNNAHVSHHLAVPNAKWLGVFPSEIAGANVKRQPLSAREAKMASQLLRTPYMAENPRIADELNVLIETNCKAGIEGLIKSDVYLSEVYLPTKFFDKDFI